jgi:hypothetical protein
MATASTVPRLFPDVSDNGATGSSAMVGGRYGKAGIRGNVGSAAVLADWVVENEARAKDERGDNAERGDRTYEEEMFDRGDDAERGDSSEQAASRGPAPAMSMTIASGMSSAGWVAVLSGTATRQLSEGICMM